MKAIIFTRNLLIFLLPVLLLATLFVFIKSPFFIANGAMNLAVTLDFVLTVPFVYFLAIRKTAIPKTTVVPIMLVGLFLGLSILPLESRNYLLLFKAYALPLVETTVFGYVVYKVWVAIRTYNKQGKELDFYDALRTVCHEVLPKPVAVPFATEIAVFYYGFLNWKKRKYKENEFTYHQKSGVVAIYLVFIFMIAVETLVFHLLIERLSVIAAWVLTALSVYTGIQILGFVKSFAKRPILIENSTLYLRFGIMSEATIQLSNIERVELSRKAPEKTTLTRSLSPLGEMEGHNVILHLQHGIDLVGLYGITKECNVIAFFVDEPERFKNEVFREKV